MLTRYTISDTVDVLSATKPTEVEVELILGALAKKEPDFESECLLVIHESEITEAVQDAITDTLYGFLHGFLAEQTGIPGVVFEKLSELGEDANNAIFAIIDSTCGFDEFCEEAVAIDGLGQFLSPYDNESNEFEVDSGVYYYFRE